MDYFTRACFLVEATHDTVDSLIDKMKRNNDPSSLDAEWLEGKIHIDGTPTAIPIVNVLFEDDAGAFSYELICMRISDWLHETEQLDRVVMFEVAFTASRSVISVFGGATFYVTHDRYERIDTGFDMEMDGLISTFGPVKEPAPWRTAKEDEYGKEDD